MNTIESNTNYVLSGNWKGLTFWNFFLSNKLPDDVESTATSGLIIWNNRIVLIEHKTRGWELPGGHIEEGESIEEALLRELHEEAGLVDCYSIKMFGFNKITNPDLEKINKVNDKPYPKYAYNPHYIIETKTIPIGCQDDSCGNVGFFNIDSQEVLNSKVRDIILVGYTCYLKDLI